MLTLYVDADACPVKQEVYRVARRYELPVKVVANAPLRVPADPRVELVVRPGFGAADDWIAGQAGPGDVVVTADIPLAARCLARGARVLGPKGQPFTDNDLEAGVEVGVQGAQQVALQADDAQHVHARIPLGEQLFHVPPRRVQARQHLGRVHVGPLAGLGESGQGRLNGDGDRDLVRAQVHV